MLLLLVKQWFDLIFQLINRKKSHFISHDYSKKKSKEQCFTNMWIARNILKKVNYRR